MSRRLLIPFGTIAILVLLFLGGLYFLLPAYLESRLSRIADDLGIGELQGDFSRPGSGSILLHDLTAGPRNNPGLRIQSIRLTYSPFGLLRKKLDRIEITGLQLRLENDDGKWMIPGLEKVFEKGKHDAGRRLEIPARAIVIRQSFLLVKEEAGEWLLPFEWRLATAAGDHWQGEAEVQIARHPLSIKTEADLGAGTAKIEARSDGLDLSSLAAAPFFPPAVKATGVLSLEAHASFSAAPFSLKELDARVRLPSASISWPPFSFQSSDRPMLLEFGKNGEEGWRLDISGLRVNGTMPVDIHRLQADFSGGSAEGSQGSYRLDLQPAVGGSGSVRLGRPLRLTGGIAVQAGNENLTFEITGEEQEKASTLPLFQLEKGTVHLTGPRFHLAGASSDLGIELLYDLSAAGSRFRRGETDFETKGVKVSGSGRVEESRLSADFFLQSSVVSVVNGNNHFSAPRIGIEGRLNRRQEELSLAVLLRLSDGRFSRSDLAAGGIDLALPFSWPLAETTPGRMAVASVAWQNRELGSLAIDCRQQGRDYLLEGSHASRQVAGLRMNFAGRAGLEKEALVDLLFEVPGFKAEEVDLGLFSASGRGMKIGGDFKADGRLTIGPETKGYLLAKWRNGTLRSQAGGVSMEGIETELELPDLPELMSAPAQRLQYARASLGRLGFGRGDIDYRVMGLDSILVEKSDHSWSGGRIRIEEMVIAPGSGEYDMVLHGEGLRIADILQQLGVAEAEGRGAVSGTIPVTIRNGLFRFGQGFLHSVPESGGLLKIREAHRLAAGIPASAPQYGQVEFALEALRNFEYNWVRFLVESIDEDLVLQLQLDGRPAEPLPFAFRRDLGLFVRLTGKGEAGITHPVRLDINFRLPLDDLLRYGSGIKQVLE